MLLSREQASLPAVVTAETTPIQATKRVFLPATKQRRNDSLEETSTAKRVKREAAIAITLQLFPTVVEA